MKYSELVQYAKQYLKEHNVSDYESDAFLFLEYVFGMRKTDYLLKMNDEILNEEKNDEYKKCLVIRGEGKPLQYITGVQDFMGLEFMVNENVLIPRYDTEILVEKAIGTIKTYNKPIGEIQVLDMCTGSGCIGISIAKLTGVNVTCVDISNKALNVAKVNASNNQVNIKFIQSDLFADVENGVKFDFIISNPPYIKSDEINGLMREVRLYEPALALDGDIDGLKFYNNITKNAKSYLSEGGWLMYEIGYDQGEDVSNLMKEKGFMHVEVIKDYANLDRVVIGKA